MKEMLKKSLAVLVGALAATLAGCVVTSVCPYYTQEDLVSEPALLGKWTNTKNPNEVWSFAQIGPFAYRFTLIDSSKTTVMEAHAFKLKGQLFLDIFSLEQDYHVIPAHYLLKVTQLEPTLQLAELNDSWLKELLAKQPTSLRHHFVKTGDKPTDRRVVLTAETPELQKFIIKHLTTEPAWNQAFELKRESRPIHTAEMKG
jgi:hypothetical protein